jgi:hypothetical protein
MFFTKERATSPLFLAFGSSSCEPREPSDAGHFNKAENARCLPPRPRSTSAALCRVASRSVRVARSLSHKLATAAFSFSPRSSLHRYLLCIFPRRANLHLRLSLSLVQTLTLATQPPWTTKLMPPWLTGVVLSMAAGLGRC